MIQLFLTRALAMHVAEHLPADDPLRLGIAEIIGREDCMGGCIDEPAALTVLRHGQIQLEVYNEAEAGRILTVLTSPSAYDAVLERSGRTRVEAAVDALAATLGIE